MAAATTDASSSKPAVAKATQLLGRRFRVTLPTGRVLTGDFQCLDKQGNLILSNAHEVIPPEALVGGGAAAAAEASSSGTSSGSSKGGGKAAAAAASPAAPLEKALGIVLVPKEQQASVSLLATLAEHAEMLKLTQ